MKILFLDLQSGISGDMLLSALIGAGVPVKYLKEELGKLNLPGWEIKISTINRNGIKGIKTDVLVKEENHPHRTLSTITDIINGSTLSSFVKSTANRVFFKLAQAESTVHKTDIDKIHFHEVGAIDSIIDIVGTAICLDYLKITEVYTTPVYFGTGTTQCMHGTISIPAPATLELLKNYPSIQTEIPFELTTPTGAAFVATLSQGMLPKVPYRWSSISYGAGAKEIKSIPNLLRASIGVVFSPGDFEEIISIECNIDDSNPEVLSYTMEKLLKQGALDVVIQPVYMKKGRMGFILNILCTNDLMDHLIHIVFEETSTIGLRYQTMKRKTLKREEIELDTPWGKMKAKQITYNENKRIIPEYEACKRAAEDFNIPIRKIYQWIRNR